MGTDDINSMFQSNIRITNMGCMNEEAVWPKNVEICVTRVPARKRDGYSAAYMEEFAKKLKNCMVKNGVVFLVCYAPTECKSRPFEIASKMEQVGFTHVDNIIVKKSWYSGKRSETNLVNSHEYVLYFCNGKIWGLDRLPVMEYLKCEETLTCPGNTWQVEVGSLDESIPEDLASLLLRMTDSLPGSLVFDPYMRNKSTLGASLRLGHSFYGFEEDKKRMKNYDKVIENYREKNGEV